MEKQWSKVIAHIDMDAFFAAVEVLLNPELRGKPLIIGSDPQKGKGRGVVSTASYEARVFGVHSAMPVSKAYRLCPHGIFVSPRSGVYGEYSRRIFSIVERFTPNIQRVSIDEAFLDLSGSVHLYGSIANIGKAIKKAISDEVNLTASIGISNSKSVAKIASDFDKPDGLTIVPPDQIQQFLDPLSISRLWGAGAKTVSRLEEMGIRTVSDLRKYPLEMLQQKMGKMGPHLHQMALGIDEREVHEREAVKSVSNERTFGVDQTDLEIIHSTLLRLSEKVAGRLRRKGFSGRTIQVKIRFSDFSTFTRHKTLSHATHATEEIYRVCLKLIEPFRQEKKAVRLMGVGVSQLQTLQGSQMNFLENADQRKENLEQIMDQLQDKFGKKALTHADTLNAKKRLKRS